MLNITDYFNSPDIRKYLKYANLDLTLLEKANIIYHSRKVSINDKLSIYRQLINESNIELLITPNTFSHNFTTRFTSDKELLDFFIYCQSIMLDEYSKPSDDAVYEIYYNGNPLCTGDLYKTLDLAIDRIKTDRPVASINIRKRYITNSTTNKHTIPNAIYGTINNNFNVTELSADVDQSIISDEVLKTCHMFECMTYYVPIPFKKGTIVYSKNNSACDPFIFVHSHKEERYDKSGDYLDMIAYGYFILDDYSLYWGSMNSYPDLEYFRLKKTSWNYSDGSGYNYNPIKYELLKEVSRHFKEKTSIDLLKKNYKRILKNHLIDSLDEKSEEEFNALTDYE